MNFVSPGFLTYSHIKKINKKFNLFTNGIDEIFIQNRLKEPRKKQNKIIEITYAGNIGVGQGLETIVLPLADHYQNKILFNLIGDGSSVNLIKNGIKKFNLNNINLIPPVQRSELLYYYEKTDIFLLQLNNIPVFEKVLPSKIFDYGSFDKPILAGVNGVAYSFIHENLPWACLFNPGDNQSVIKYIDSIVKHGIPKINNEAFINKFSRKKIMDNMLESIILNRKY